MSLGDLRLTIQPGKWYNLLDGKSFSYTEEQLKKSQESGSLHLKKHMVKVTDTEPNFSTPIPKKTLSEFPMQRKPRSVVTQEEPDYEELLFSDEKFAEEMSEFFTDDDLPDSD